MRKICLCLSLCMVMLLNGCALLGPLLGLKGADGSGSELEQTSLPERVQSSEAEAAEPERVPVSQAAPEAVDFDETAFREFFTDISTFIVSPIDDTKELEQTDGFWSISVMTASMLGRYQLQNGITADKTENGMYVYEIADLQKLTEDIFGYAYDYDKFKSDADYLFTPDGRVIGIEGFGLEWFPNEDSLEITASGNTITAKSTVEWVNYESNVHDETVFEYTFEMLDEYNCYPYRLVSVSELENRKDVPNRKPN